MEKSKINFITKDGDVISLDTIKEASEFVGIKKDFADDSRQPLYKRQPRGTVKEKRGKPATRYVPLQEYIMDKYPALKECKNPLEKVIALIISGDSFSYEVLANYADINLKSIWFYLNKIRKSKLGANIEIIKHPKKKNMMTFRYTGEPIEFAKAVKIVKASQGKKAKAKIKPKAVPETETVFAVSKEQFDRVVADNNRLLEEVERLKNVKSEVATAPTLENLTISSEDDIDGLLPFVKYCVKRGLEVKLTVK